MDSLGGRPARSARLRPIAPVTTLPVAPVAMTIDAAPRQVRQRSAPRRHRFAMTSALLVASLFFALGGWILWPRGANHKLTALSIATSVVKSSVGAKTTLQGESAGRTNMLIYGMTKDGLRTDSIMLASYYWKDKKLVTLNIPRDLEVSDGYETAKFGEVYAYAYMRNKKNPQYASQYVADLVAKEYGLPINYWVKFNMQGEVQLVDTLGGVDVTVEHTFADYEYPTWTYSGYIRPAPHFVAGPQHMTGDTALIYSRSRHSLDAGEGTDFARSKRQMIVLASVLTKVKSLGLVGNLTDISRYLTILGNNVDTNMSTDEMVAFAGVAKNLDTQTDLVRGNWSTDNGFLCSATSSVGAYVARYGTLTSCLTPAGAKVDSKYRELAIYYVQHLLESAPLIATDFISNALPSLPSPYAVPASATASSGTTTGTVLSAGTHN
jgi:LCP family protein required for cell wall assembly